MEEETTNSTGVNPARLFVGGVAWATTDDSLRNAFSNAGTVVYAKVIRDKRTGRSKGYAFVEMASSDEAQKAIELFDNNEVDGRAVRVNVAKPMNQQVA